MLVVASVLLAVPAQSFDNHSPATYAASPSFNSHPIDPNGTLNAFNWTAAHFDLYTHSNATVGPTGNVTWFSNLNNTVDGQPIPETAFHFNMTGPSLRETINYTLTIPKGAGPTTFVKFDWNGTVGTGTSARYLLSNSTSNSNSDASKIFFKVVRNVTFTGASSSPSIGGQPISCGPTDDCFDVTSYVGLNITLTFLFNSTLTATGRLKATVSNVEVASVAAPTPAVSHALFVNPSDSSEIIHSGRLLLTYNSTVTYKKPNTSGQFLNHTWHQMLLSFYIPATYRLDNATLDGIRIDNVANRFGQPHDNLTLLPCITQGTIECTRAIFFSLNMTTSLINGFPGNQGKARTALFTARTTNAISSLNISLGGTDTDFWTPGDNLTLRISNAPGVNITGSQVAWLQPNPNPTGIIPVNVTLATAIRGGTANYTISLPSSPLGEWTLTTTFANGYDYGYGTHNLRIDEMQVNSGSFSAVGGVGSGTSLSVGGKLSYVSNSSAAGNVNATVFAISPGTGASLAYTKAPASTGLYISNITEVSGIGTVHQPIITYFTVINSTSSLFSANLTIEHEWYSGQTHEMNATITDLFGTFSDTLAKTPLTYSMEAAFTAAGIQLTITSLQTRNMVTVIMSNEASLSPVSFLRQHFGLFKLTLHVKNLTDSSQTSLFLESPPYAYLLYTPLVPSQLLAFSPTVTTISADGSFSTSLSSNQLLGVKRLVFIVLARDSNGVVLGDQARDPTVSSDSTTLTPTADIPGDVAVQQSVDTTLHLKNNSTSYAATLTVNLDVTGPVGLPTQTRSVTIQPGRTQDVMFTFTAPSSAGTYLITFSSPQYSVGGSPFLAKTLRVSLLSSNLQILLPAAIGLVAAIIIAAVYVVKRPAKEEEDSEKTRPKASGPSKPQSGSKPRNP